LFADMGYAEASRREASQVSAVSVRFLSDIVGLLKTAQRRVDSGQCAEAAEIIDHIEEVLHRGIACGALVDPWNILGFQAMFPLASAQEDSIHDTRIDELIFVVGEIFNLHARLLREAAATGNTDLIKRRTPSLRRLAAWWDRFASVEVQDVPRLLGAEEAK